MEMGLNIIKLVFLFGVAILVHEIGHFVAARLFGIRILRFSIGFPPRLFGVRRGDTDYCVGLIPVGGYVKLSGEEWLESGKIEPHDLMAKPWWARIIVYGAGVTMNVVLAYFLFFGHLIRGIEIPNYPPVVGSIDSGSVAYRSGLRIEDRILRVGDREVDDWSGVVEAVDAAAKKDGRVSVTVSRNGARRAVVLPLKDGLGLTPFVDPVIGEAVAMQPARKAGLREGDRIVSINGRGVREWGQVSDAVAKSAGKPVRIAVRRAGEKIEFTVTPEHNHDLDRPLIGISAASPAHTMHRVSLPRAALGAAAECWILTSTIVGAVWEVASGRRRFKEVLGGPVLIAGVGYQKAKKGIWDLIHFMAMLNLSLMVVNLLPIPALDGGAILLALWEGVRRRRISPKVYGNLTTAGFAAMIALMVYALYNDILRIVR